jgi:UDP:flavonoid glycosyltransferase YjiC (YdhE family)
VWFDSGVRILFSTQPGHGHLNPLLPVASACQDADHTVLFATAPRFCSTVEKHGFECRAAGMDYLWSEALASFPEIAQAPWGPEQGQWLTEQVAFPRLVRPMAKDLLPLFEELKPDLVVIDFADWGARLAADVAGIPYAVCSWGFEGDMDVSFAWNLYDDVRREFGLGSAPVRDPSAAPWLRLSPLPERWVRDSAPSSPTTHRFKMALHDAPPDATLPAWFHELPDRPLIYATMGTVIPIAPLTGWLIDGLSALDANVVITTGRSFDPSSLGSLPANVHVEQFIPQSLLLEHCDLIVSHAGFGTILGGMRHGVPMILMQLAADHWYNAERCGELGVARIVGRDARTPEGLRELARDALADKSLRSNVATMKAAFTDLPDVRNAVPLMERLAREKIPIT